MLSEAILAAMRDMLASKYPYGSEVEVETELEQIVLSSVHMKPFAKAMQDARLAKAAKEAWDAVFKGQIQGTAPIATFVQTEADALTVIQES